MYPSKLLIDICRRQQLRNLADFLYVKLLHSTQFFSNYFIIDAATSGGKVGHSLLHHFLQVRNRSKNTYLKVQASLGEVRTPLGYWEHPRDEEKRGIDYFFMVFNLILTQEVKQMLYCMFFYVC